MGGQVNKDLEGGVVTHMVVNKTGLDKYTAADGFSVGPFKGCTVCVTGIPADQRKLIQRDIIQYGGRFTSALQQGSSTHLICAHATGPKYTAALQWGIKCVTRQWLTDTIKTLELADESDYPVVTTDNKSSTRSSSTNNSSRSSEVPKGLDEDEDMKDEPIAVPDQMYLEACHVYLCWTFTADQAARFKKIIRFAGGIHVAEYHPLEVTHVVVPSDTLDSQTLALFNHTSELPYIIHQKWLRMSHREGKILPEADYIVPFPTRTKDGQPKPMNFEGATTWTTDRAVAPKNPQSLSGSKVATLRSRTRNSIVDSDSSSTTTSGKSSTSVHPSSSEQSPVMSRNGLRERTVSGILTNALGDLNVAAGTPSIASEPSSTQFAPTQLTQSQFASTLPRQQESTRISSTQGKSATDAGDPQHMDDQDDAPIPKIFLGLYITAHGCKETITNSIREHTLAGGGTYFEETEVPAVPENLVRTIVPLSISMDMAKDLPGIVMTTCWFERSLWDGRVISRNDNFLIGFQNLCISVSTANLKEFEYKQIGRAIKILGGTFFDKLHTVSTNLLISDVPVGPKYEFMAKNGRPVVRMAWLKQCAEEGRLLPYDEFLLKVDSPTGSTIDHDIGGARAQSSTRDCSSESLLSNGHLYTSQVSEVPHNIPSDKPLDGLAICLPIRVSGSYTEMQTMIMQMGARFLASYDASATHFIHKGKATADAKRDLRAAKRDGLHIVSPEWLYKCREARVRVNEREYPETYDEKHLTLSTTPTEAPMERPPLSVLPKRATSPSLRTPAARSAKGKKKSQVAGFGRSVSGGYSQRQNNGLSISSQQFHGTASDTTSTMYAYDSMPSSVRVPSGNSSVVMSQFNATDPHSLPLEESGTADESGIWKPVPYIPPTRSSSDRKRRRAAPASDDLSLSAPISDISMVVPADESFDGMSIPEDYFNRTTGPHGKDDVYWMDVEGREKKRALMMSLGYKPVKSTGEGSKSTSSDQNGSSSYKTQDAGGVTTKYFLLTGIMAQDRSRFRKAILSLGGVILEDVTQDQKEWSIKCTHLVTNGNNPPRTAKIVAARSGSAFIVNKSYMYATIEAGHFVDEEQYLVPSER
ncbi:DNA topoisomerase 2-binding protein 1 [Haplosporangium sp. Z 11]|nr:DNA topoisomerase 2-binding protein 1 [Haplosporangium sp. Z 11]